MDLWVLWGKTSKDQAGNVIPHPLLCHMIDVAEVTGALWDLSLGDGLRRHVTDALGCNEADARQTLMFWAALHDLGKASPAFQCVYAPAIPLLETEGLMFTHEFGGYAGAWHGLISAWALPLLLELYRTPRPLARDLARGLGGHHGSWPPPGFGEHLTPDQKGDRAWDEARQALSDVLAVLYPPTPLDGRLAARAERQALVTLVSGMVSVADWLGSMQNHFPATPEPDEPRAYAHEAAKRAREALRQEQWDRWQAPRAAATFETLFPDKHPHPAQQAIIELAGKLDGPSLVLIEAPTGSGKTEAALYLADYWAHTLQQRGLYVAMPTTATSNQMHGRVAAMLDARYGRGTIAPLLVHGQARWSAPPHEINQETMDKAEGADGVEAMSWFLPLKRSLLAPFGVGTVDQALLSVLLTRHFFVRMFGLAGKTIIFDEVHAYDTYMSTLFGRLLGWLRAQGSTVIMLSATLPAATRRAFLKAYGAPEVLAHEAQSYPAVTWASGNESGCQPLPAPADRSLAIEWLPHDEEHLIDALRKRLAEGGCAAVLCNTVARAQAVYCALRDAAIVPPEDLTLFHARYPLAWRQEIECRVVRRYGKEGAPEQRRGIVVATQVIEQSLDLDFDLMVSDLAPIDLLVQRAGRLHRHERTGRPAPVAEPRLLLIEPQNAADLPTWGNDAYVYAPYILLRTWLTLQGRTALVLPAQTQELIEAVYGETEPAAEGAMAAALEAAKEEWQESRRREEMEADVRLVPSVDSAMLFAKTNLNLGEEDPTAHASLSALTRWGGESITVVCLHRQGEQIFLDENHSEPVELQQSPSNDLTAKLVRSSVQISHRGIVALLAGTLPPASWRRHSLLRHYRLVEFEDGQCALPASSYVLHLDHELGLSIDKEAY